MKSWTRTKRRAGVAVLSGILADQAEEALAARAPLSVLRRIELDGWVTLLLER